MFKQILLPVDLVHPESQKKAIETAGELARTYGAGLHAITVVPDVGKAMIANSFPAGYEEAAIEAAGKELAALLISGLGAETEIELRVVHGSIYHEIVDLAEEIGCDLIVMAAHRPTMRDVFIGPNAIKVVSHTRQSVIVVRDDG